MYGINHVAKFLENKGYLKSAILIREQDNTWMWSCLPAKFGGNLSKNNKIRNGRAPQAG
jgi:hypothetical protein